MLGFTQLGMLRKDDAFEVVHDPGPDKLEKRVLGPAPFLNRRNRSTGERKIQPRRILLAKFLVPCGKRLGSRHSPLRGHDDACRGRQLLQGKYALSAPHAQHHSTDQEQRQVGADLRRELQLLFRRQRLVRRFLKAQQRRYGVGRRSARASLHRQPLFDFDNYPPPNAKKWAGTPDHAITRVRLVGGNARIGAANLNAPATLEADLDQIMQADGLIDREQFVKTVMPGRANAQAQVDLREGSQGDGHATRIKSHWQFLSSQFSVLSSQGNMLYAEKLETGHCGSTPPVVPLW